MVDNIDEKFVSDDGVSSVEDAVTPEGGKSKKKLADKVSQSDEKPAGETLKEELSDLFEGVEVSEDFKNRLAVIFSASVNEAVNEKTSETESIYESALQEAEEKYAALQESAINEATEALQEQMNEAIEEITENMVENLDKYLDYVVENWLEENRIAIETGLKVEMAESMLNGLKELFVEHNVEIDTDTVDVISEMEERMAKLEEKTNDAINESIEMAEELASLKAEKVFSGLTEGLSTTQAERLRVLSEKLDISDLDDFSANVEILKESFFKEPAKTKLVLQEEASTDLNEDLTPVKKSSDNEVNAILEALNLKNYK
jgi:hypothetical protein